MKKNLTTCLAIMVLLAGCTKRNTPAENENTSRIVPHEEATAAVNAGTVQQTIQGFGGMSHPICRYRSANHSGIWRYESPYLDRRFNK
jgi:glucuronoarabinoxylan endo-1,4-beta-xylanase